MAGADNEGGPDAPGGGAAEGVPCEPAATPLGQPELPPAESVPRPPPPVALRVFGEPRVDGLGPTEGPVLGETKVTLSGANLYRETIVRFAGLIAQTVGASEPKELRVLSPPADRAGAVDVTLENPRAPVAVLAGAFRYLSLPAPRITSVAPNRVATRGGAELTITGEHFVRGAIVLLDGKPAAAVSFVGPTTLDVHTPPGVDGKLVDVTVKNPDGRTDVVPRAFMYDGRLR